MNHFDVLREAISAEGGTIVKTIGDAVMAAFRRPVAALRAMLRAQQELASAPASAARLVLKVGIHQGPCIAVTLNERLDYFGTTVNIASRIQNLSVGGDVVISSAIYDDPEVQAWLGNPENQLHLEAFDAKLKGIADPVRLWRIVRAPTE
jgi:class 3 adenylate cyclase